MFKMIKFVAMSILALTSLTSYTSYVNAFRYHPLHTTAVRIMRTSPEFTTNTVIDCQVCINALQTELTKNNDNFIEFAANAPESCAAATMIDDQKVACAVALIKNSKQLFKDEKNAVPVMTSCLNIGAQNCMPIPTTMPPTKNPTTVPTKTPTTAPPTKTPTKPPTKPPVYDMIFKQNLK